MKKKILILIIIVLVAPISVHANIICNDGTTSPTCTDCHRGCCSYHGGCSNNTNYNSNNNTTSNYKTYTRQKSSNTNIRNLVINGKTLYNIYDSNSVTVYKDKVDVKVNLSDSSAKYEVYGDTNLSIGESKTLSIIVTAEDGTTKTYFLEITRANKESDVNLTLYINGKRIKFNGNDSYSTSKKFKNNKVTFKYDTSDEVRSVEIRNKNIKIGKTSKLKKGNNKFKIILIDVDGNQRTYKVNIKRKK